MSEVRAKIDIDAPPEEVYDIEREATRPLSRLKALLEES